ncbi:hypothetical protein [Inquilinus sp.]|jgi:hypothetical protein|uniref:hypothetical protein n=1 Tax=Inquilinus sp. TaxID=1932117 RepID=UPI0037831120
MVEDDLSSAPKDRWDADLARQLIDKVIIVGMTRTDPRDTVIRQEQFFGRVVAVDDRRGITLALEGSREGETYVLPPDTRSFVPAPAGSYRLRATGEVVIDPDFTATWTLQQTRDS